MSRSTRRRNREIDVARLPRDFIDVAHESTSGLYQSGSAAREMRNVGVGVTSSLWTRFCGGTREPFANDAKKHAIASANNFTVRGDNSCRMVMLRRGGIMRKTP